MVKKNRNLLLTAFLIFVLTASLGGCTTLGRSYPKKNSYILDVTRSGASSNSTQGTLLKVKRFRVASHYEGKEFVYSKGGLSFKSDFYNRFFTAPATMIAEEVREWIADAGFFETVLPRDSRLTATHVLEGNIDALYGDYSGKRSSQAVMEITFNLIRKSKSSRQSVFQKSYRKEFRLEQGSPTVLVEGWNGALEKILIAFEKDLSRTDIRVVP